MLQLRGFNLLVTVSRNGHWPKTLMNSVLTEVTQWLINITWYKTSALIIFEIYLYVQKLHYFEMSVVSIFFLKCLELLWPIVSKKSTHMHPLWTFTSSLCTLQHECAYYLLSNKLNAYNQLNAHAPVLQPWHSLTQTLSETQSPVAALESLQSVIAPSDCIQQVTRHTTHCTDAPRHGGHHPTVRTHHTCILMM